MDHQEAQQEEDVFGALKDQFQAELDQCRRELKEVKLMLEQSRGEVNKLGQRNASIAAHLKQTQAQFESLPRGDIRMAYDSALDAQQRLFVMRGQVDKLQSDEGHLNRHIKLLEQVLQAMEGGMAKSSAAKGGTGKSTSVEQLIQAQEAERQRLSRQMHDGPAQTLSNFIWQTEIAMRLFDVDQAKAKEELSTLKVTATTTFRKVRDFIFELRPMMLDDLGLVPTLKRYVDAFKEQVGVEIRLSVTGSERRLASYQEVMIFRAIQELLNNIAMHGGQNKQQVKVQLDMGETTIKVSVDDDGKGFDVDTLSEKGGTGLQIIRDRVEMMGGSMDIDSKIGRGTRVAFQIPAVAAATPAPAPA